MSGATGTTVIDFGAFPGATDASVAVTGQTGILAGSFVEAWIVPTDTTDHLADEHIADPPRILAGKVVAGVGFTIYGVLQNAMRIPSMLYRDRESGSGGTIDNSSPMVYGKWTVAWVWV